MKTILLVLAGTFFTSLSFGQESSLTGNLTDEMGYPLERAYVVLLDSETLEYVIGTTTDHNGFFELTSLEKGCYTLMVDHRTMEEPMEVDNINTCDYDVLTSVVYTESANAALYVDLQPNLEPTEAEIEYVTLEIE